MIRNIFRAPLEIQIIVDAIKNDPDSWRDDGYWGLKYTPLNIIVQKDSDWFLFGMTVTVKGVPVALAKKSWRIAAAVSWWRRRLENIARRRLIDDDHTQRVRRIIEAKAAVARDEQAHINSLLEGSQ